MNMILGLKFSTVYIVVGPLCFSFYFHFTFSVQMGPGPFYFVLKMHNCIKKANIYIYIFIGAPILII